MAQRRVDIVLSAKDEATKVLNNLANGTLPALVKQFGGMVASTLSAGAAISFVSSSIGKFAESEKITRKLEGALRDAGLSVEANSAHLDKMALSLSRVTLADDEAIKSAQTLLISLGGLAGKGLDRATEAALDLSARLGKDLNESATMIAKAAQGSTKAFSQLGVKFREGASDGEKFATVLDFIHQNMGTAAEAEVDTLAGSVAQLAKEWDNLKESVGGAIAASGWKDVIADTAAAVSLVTDLAKRFGLGPAVSMVGRAMATQGESLGRLRQMVDEAEEADRLRRLGRTKEQDDEIRAEEEANLLHKKESERFWQEEEERAAKAAEAIAKRIKAARDKVLFDMEFGAPVPFKESQGKPSAFGGELSPGAFGQLSPQAFKPDPALEAGLNRARSDMQTLAESFSKAEQPATNVQFAMKEIAEMQKVVIANGGVWTEQWMQLSDEILRAAEHADSFTGQLESALKDRLTVAAYEFGDALVDVAFDGEVSFSKFAKAVLKDIARIITQLLIARAIATFFGPAAPVAGGMGVAIADGTIAASTGGLVFGPGQIQRFAAGGFVRPMGSDIVPAMLTPGEMVVPARQTQAVLGGRAVIGAPGAMGGGRTVVLNLNVNAIDTDSVRRHAKDTARIYIDAIREEEARGY